MIGGLNKLLVEPYKGSGKPEAEVKSGFATVKQRSSLVGLKLMADAIVSQGSCTAEIKKGAVIYFKETDLSTMPWTKTRMTCDAIEGEFLIADYTSVVAIK